MTKTLQFLPQPYRLWALVLFSIFFGGVYFSNANAQEPQSKFIDILPTITQAENINAPLPGNTTHKPITLTPDKSEIIRLNTDARSIIVGNPIHLSILADSPRTLVLVPRAIGATHFSVLDNRGNTIMQRHVIVAGPKTNYIRIRKTCPGDSEECEENSVYYCPDTCHEIKSPTDDAIGSSASTGTE